VLPVCLLLALSQANICGQTEPPDDQSNPLFDQLTEHRSSRCSDFIYNAKLLIPRLHREGKLDSVGIVLDYVENACGKDSFWPLRDLLRVEAGTYPEDPCDSSFLNMILRQQWGRWSFFETIFCPPPWSSDLVALSDSVENQYEQFLDDLTDDLISSTDSNSVAHLAVRYYRGDRDYVIGRLRRDEFSGTCLQDAYWNEVNKVKHDMWEKRAHWAGNVGAWFPFDSASVLGPKVEMGGQLGRRWGRFGLDFTLLFRFLKTENEYSVMYKDSLHRTDDFFGGLIGAETTFELFRLGRGSLEMFGGIGYDGFDAYEDDSDDKRSKTIHSFNINFGLTPRLFINKVRDRYLGLQLRYNIVNYDTDGGSDLSGNTLSVNLVYGYMGNGYASDRAKDLHLYD
jgi:hypothetical protein